jgi:hypothetical protein
MHHSTCLLLFLLRLVIVSCTGGLTDCSEVIVRSTCTSSLSIKLNKYKHTTTTTTTFIRTTNHPYNIMSSTDNTSEEEILRKQLKPNPTNDEVIDVIRTNYFNGDDSSVVDIKLIKELDSYDDRNLWISVNGKDYLAKVHNGVESRDMIQFLTTALDEADDDDNNNNKKNGDYRKSAIHLQNAIMEHLNECNITTNQPQLPSIAAVSSTSASSVAGVVATLSVVSSEHSPTPLIVRLLGWVEGTPMSSFPMLPIEGIADSGRFLGNLSHALSTLPNSDQLLASKRYHQWYVT